jgi:hypothetical protein
VVRTARRSRGRDHAAAAFLLAAFAAATRFGVAPAMAFFGSSGRHEGLHVMVSLVAIMFAVSTFDERQTEALVTAVPVGTIGPCVYSIVRAIVTAANTGHLPRRLGSTFGNPILLGGNLIVAAPITTMSAIPARRGSFGYRLALGLQLTALAIARTKGTWIADAAAAAGTAAATLDVPTRRRRAVAAIALVCRRRSLRAAWRSWHRELEAVRADIERRAKRPWRRHVL